ncbi:MAG: nSTAND1 domain-containing NTPase [Nocardioides sp.]
MDFHVLGTLRASSGGVDLEIRGAKERTLLAHLVAYAGQVVPAAALIESMWGDDPPRSAAKSLQTYVLRLRNSLEPDRDGKPRLLLTDGAGYRLAISSADTDAGRFARLADLARQALAGGRPEAAVEASRDALALWHGPAYAGCEGTAFGRAEARRLEELRLAVLETWVEGNLALGRESAVVPELEGHVGEHPLRERLWELLMLAHYRQGEQGQALATYGRARELLADQLGVDPGQGLRALHAGVLAQDPSLQRAGRRVALPPGLRDDTPIVGRDAELEVLRAAWQRTLAGSPQTVVVRGPAGAGATRLAAALAHEVARDGADVATAADEAHDEPWLLVVDAASARPDRAMLLHLAGPSTTPPSSATVIDLAPLSEAEVRRVVGSYVSAGDVDEVTGEVLAAGPAWPGRVHDAAARLARHATAQRLAAAVGVASETSARLTHARAEVSESIVNLGDARTPETAREPGTCPWRGLTAYEIEDAPWFAGREHLVAELLSRLATTRLVAIVGASGSGKSSALRAGVLAALARDVLPGSSTWRRVVMRPGSHPMRELARAALGSGSGELGDLLAHLIRTEGSAQRTLLVIDQMEELWTACEDQGERATFLDTLVELLADPRSSTSVVLAVRADYVAAAAEHTELAALMADGTVLVGSPTPAEIERAITRPAARAGVAIQDGLAETMVDDAGSEPGLLPLLSVALTEVWARRTDERLTYAGYVEVGGIAGAISTLAEDAWSKLTADEQPLARVLLQRLAGPGDGATVVRRRVPLAELEALSMPGLRGVLDRLAEARLLAVGDTHVEVAHEALFREWPRLRDWLTDDATGRAVQRRLALAASEWDAEDREPGTLWRGTRLLSGLEVAAARPAEITHVEQAFLDAGREAEQAEEDAVRARAAATARQNRRLRGLLVGTAVLLLVALLAGALAMRARGDAEESATRAQASAVSADARRLAANALNEDRPAVALLQAVEATRREQSPETYGALLTLLTRSPDIATRFRIDERFLRIRASADGTAVYLSDNTNRLFALDAVTGEELWTAVTPGGDAQWGIAAVGPRGRWLAVPLIGDPESLAMAVIDAGTGEVRHEVVVADLAAQQPDTSPWVDESAHRLGDEIVITTQTHAFLVDPETGAVVRSMPFGSHSPYSWGLGGGRIAAQTDDPRRTRVLDLRTGRQGVRPGSIVGADAGGNRLITSVTRTADGGDESSYLQLRDAAWRPVGGVRRVDGRVAEAAFLPGQEVAVARDEVVDLHDARTLGFVRTLEGHSGVVLGIELGGPAGDLLWTAGRDGTAVGFDLSGVRGVLRTNSLDVAADAAAAAAGRAAVTERYETELNTARILDLEAGRDLYGELQPFTDCVCQIGHTAITPDGKLALAGVFEWTDDFSTAITDRGRVVGWDTDTGTLTHTIDIPWEPHGLAVTPDGERLLVNGSGGYALYDLASGEALWSRETDLLSDWIAGLPLSGTAPDGSRLVVLRGETVVVLDPDSGDVVVSGELPGAGALTRVAFSADGRSMALGSDSGRLYFLDVVTLDRVAPDRLVSAGFVIDLQMSPDGSLLAVMGTDGDVTLFDSTTWRPYGKPVVDGLGWGFLSFTEDSLRIYGETGPDYELATDPAEWVAAGCRVANTEFTAEESAVILPGERAESTCS